jgi:hypothetical protein
LGNEFARLELSVVPWEFEEKIGGKSIAVSPDLLIEPPSRHPV